MHSTDRYYAAMHARDAAAVAAFRLYVVCVMGEAARLAGPWLGPGEIVTSMWLSRFGKAGSILLSVASTRWGKAWPTNNWPSRKQGEA